MMEESNSSNSRYSAYREVEEMGFFAYSGADGDLFRKHGLAGWRLSLCAHVYKIQKKSEFWEKHGKNVWGTKFEVTPDDGERLDESQKKEFVDKVRELVENGGLEVEEQDS